jgi:hypothetical protein
VKVIYNMVRPPSTPGEATDYPLIWRVAARLPERKGRRCRVLVRSRRMNSALVEFEDGFQVVTSRNYVRRAPAG